MWGFSLLRFFKGLIIRVPGMGQRYSVVIGLCDSRGSWLRHMVSGSYYISYLN